MSIGRRVYDATLRRDRARVSQRRIVEAARTLLLEQGYAATTMTAVANAAGVSVETIYKTVGGKAALVKAVWDITLVGDDEPVPLAQRPEFAVIYAEPDPRQKIARFVALGTVLQQRLAPLWTIVDQGASAGNVELQQLRATIERERLAGAERIVTQLDGFVRHDLDVQQARDQVWTLISPEVRRLLVDGRGWSIEEYETWVSGVLADSLLDGSRSS